ncbi:hypothetical protein AgCh_006401 [Apium graveolens]
MARGIDPHAQLDYAEFKLFSSQNNDKESSSTKCLTPESSNQPIFIPDNNSSKFLSAVTDSHRAQIASESVQLATAIQLFIKSKGLRYGSKSSGASAMKKAEMVESSEMSNINHVLSLLVPHPRESKSMLAPDEHVGSKPSSESFTENVHVSQADCGRYDQLEIIFEYFESEQPQRRRPLYDM